MPVKLDALRSNSRRSPDRLNRSPRTIATAGLALALMVCGGEGHDARAQGPSPSPSPAPGSLSTAPMVAAGGGTSFVLKSNGTVLGWGNQLDGRLGDGQDSDASRTQPRPVLGLGSIRQIAVGAAHGLALRADGVVFAWGANGDGRLGNGQESGAETTPVRVPRLASVAAVAAGLGFSMALHSDGTVFVWGQNVAGQLGLGDDTPRAVPTSVPSLSSIRVIAAGGGQAFAIRRDGVVFGWGNNQDGQLGLGSRPGSDANVPAPRVVAALAGLNVTAIAVGGFHIVALLADGSLRTFGASNFGQAGSPSGVDGFGTFPSPIRPAGIDSVTAVAAGQYHTLALRRDGSALSWGNASEGRLGDGSSGRSQSSSLPGGVGAGGIVAIAAGERQSLIILRDGTVACFGSNFLGQCGRSQGFSELLRPTAVPGANVLE